MRPAGRARWLLLLVLGGCGPGSGPIKTIQSCAEDSDCDQVTSADGTLSVGGCLPSGRCDTLGQPCTSDDSCIRIGEGCAGGICKLRLGSPCRLDAECTGESADNQAARACIDSICFCDDANVSCGTFAQNGTTPLLLPLRVAGNQLIDTSSRPIQLIGASHGGANLGCVGGSDGNGPYQIFEGETDSAAVAAMAAWNINAVRVPLNEDCPLGLNGVPDALAGSNYITAVQGFVNLLHSFNMYVILELHWTAPGVFPSRGQQPLPDADHALDFWTLMAGAFSQDPFVIFDLHNEPYVSTANAQTQDPWACWRDGCLITNPAAPVTISYQAAGMNALIAAVRATGATAPLMLGGLAYANDLTHWVDYWPNDPMEALIASAHIYDFTSCKTLSCWQSQLQPVMQSVPLITGELGETDCGHSFVDQYMSFADPLGLSYLGWVWDTWPCNTPSLITDWSGTPTVMGASFQAHALARTQ